MLIRKTDLLNAELDQLQSEEDLTFSSEELVEYPRIRKILQAHVEYRGKYDSGMDHLYMMFHIQGKMIVPCDITLEDAEYDYDFEETVDFVFHEEEDPNVYVIKENQFETKPIVLQLIHQDIPLKVVKKGKIDYPKGNGWEVMTEEEYQKSKENQIDPRWAKLAELQKDEK